MCMYLLVLIIDLVERCLPLTQLPIRQVSLKSYWPGKKISSPQTTGLDFFQALHHVHGSLYVSGKLPTYPSPKPTFCLKSEVSVNVGLGEG